MTDTDTKRELDDLRQQMIRLDEELLRTLERRAAASRRVGEIRSAQPPTLPVTDRASQRALVARASGVMPEDALREIFREVYACALSLELPVNIAFAGPEGGTGHACARGRFGAWSRLVPCDDVAAALDEVSRRRVEFAVVPFETSADGPVHGTIAALVAHELKIVEVLDASFDLHLMNKSGDAGDIAKVYATPADHAECASGLAKAEDAAGRHRFTMIDARSPLVACQLAAEDPQGAAVARELVGSHERLVIARRGVREKLADRARYAVVGSRPSRQTGADVTAVAFSVHDTPGALLDVLKQLAERGLNMTKIQSRPTDGEGWNYLFFVEIAGHATDRAVISAFEDVRRLTKLFKVLGSYPAL